MPNSSKIKYISPAESTYALIWVKPSFGRHTMCPLAAS
jgi:hypothetical protein